MLMPVCECTDSCMPTHMPACVSIRMSIRVSANVSFAEKSSVDLYVLRSLVMKYSGHYAIQLTHQGPAALWAERFFSQNIGACRRRAPRTCINLNVSKDTSHRDLSDPTLRFGLALGVRRRHASEKRLKNPSALGRRSSRSSCTRSLAGRTQGSTGLPSNPSSVNTAGTPASSADLGHYY